MKARFNAVEAANDKAEDEGRDDYEDSSCTKKTFMPTLKIALDLFGDNKLVGGFRRSGIYPHNPMEPHKHPTSYAGNLKNKATASVHDEIRGAINDTVPHDDVTTLVLPKPKDDVELHKSMITYIYKDSTIMIQPLDRLIKELYIPDSVGEIVSCTKNFDKKFVHFDAPPYDGNGTLEQDSCTLVQFLSFTNRIAS